MSAANPSRTSGPTDDSRYIFLENAVSRQNATHMLGAVVPRFYKTRPYDNYRPNWRDPALQPERNGEVNQDWKQLEDTMNAIWTDAGQPVPLQDVLARKKLAVSQQTHLKFTSLLTGLFHKARSEEIEIKSGTVKFYSFDNPGPNLYDLLFTCEPWKTQVEKLVHGDKRGEGYFIVTGVAVVKDAEVSWIESQSTTKEAAAKVPGEVLNAATQGVVPIVGPVARAADAEVKWQKVAQEGAQVFARCTEEIIVAIKYDELDLVMEPDNDSDAPKKDGFWSRVFTLGKPKDVGQIASPHVRKMRKVESVTLGLPIRGNGFNSAFGSEKSSSSSLSDLADEDQYSNHLTVGKERDVFCVAKAPYIRAEDSVRVLA